MTAIMLTSVTTPASDSMAVALLHPVPMASPYVSMASSCVSMAAMDKMSWPLVNGVPMAVGTVRGVMTIIVRRAG